LLGSVAMLWPFERDQTPMNVAVGSWPGVETLVLASEQNLLPGRDINLVEMSWTSAAMVAFEKRVVSACVVSLDEMLRLEAGGHHPKAIMVMGISRGGDAILAKPEIGSIAQLRGKRVGVELRGAGEYLLARALTDSAMKLADVTLIPINVTESESRFEDGDFDAVVVADPWRTRLHANGLRTLMDSSKMGNELSRVLIVRSDSLNESEESVKLLVSAHLAERARLNGAMGEETWLQPILRREGLDEKQFLGAMGAIQMPSKEENLKLLAGRNGGLMPVLRRMSVFMHKQGLTMREVTVEHLLTAKYIAGGDSK